jgi:hypothetical protein
MSITKRTSIDSSIFQELQEKYPMIENEKGVCYKQKLEYVTFEIDFLDDPELRNMVEQYGSAVIHIVFYLRVEMCKNGWNVRAGSTYRMLISDISHKCNIDGQLTHIILQELVHREIIKGIMKDGETWLTCAQQIYNYEMACNNRLQSQKRQEKKRKKDKEKLEKADKIISSQKIEEDPFT